MVPIGPHPSVWSRLQNSVLFKTIHSHAQHQQINSINSEIDTSLFQCDWGSFLDCFSAVLDAHPGTQVAVFDVDSAHRRMPIRPRDRLHVCVAWQGLVYMDHCCCFSCTSSSGIFGRCADAIKEIFLSRGVNLVLKWADDFTFWRRPCTDSASLPWFYLFDELLIWETATELGWPWSPEKCTPFAHRFRYIGFDWDLLEKTVSIPDSKRLKFLEKLAAWRPGRSVDNQSCLSLIGSLNHCSVVIPSSRAHLPSLHAFAARFARLKSRFIRLFPPRDVLNDLCWWTERLSIPNCGIQIKAHGPAHDVPFFVDASTIWGIGLIYGGKWLAWPLLEGWKTDGRDIGWAEMVALELAVLAAVQMGIRKATLIIRSDNRGVVLAFTAGQSCGARQNAVLQRILLILYEHDLWLQVSWIPSTHNPADGPSRGHRPAFPRLPFPPKVPACLRPFVGHAVDL